MKRVALLFCLFSAGVLLMWAQRGRFYLEAAPSEVKLVFPKEVSPGKYQQVDARDLQALADDGWELVSVTPYVYLNEERGATNAQRPVVTQTYPAYFFKRLKAQTPK